MSTANIVTGSALTRCARFVYQEEFLQSDTWIAGTPQEEQSRYLSLQLLGNQISMQLWILIKLQMFQGASKFTQQLHKPLCSQ